MVGASGGFHHGRQADVRNRSPPLLVGEQSALELCDAQGRQVWWSREGRTDSAEDPHIPRQRGGFGYFSFTCREVRVGAPIPFLLAVNSEVVGFPGGANGKEPACQCRRGKRRYGEVWGGSSGGGNSSPLQYSSVEHPTNGGAWRAAVCGARTRK